MNKRNLEMIADFYEFTMANGYLEKNMNDIAYFDVFFRKIPDNGGFAIFAGLEQIINFIKDFSFSKEDINYLEGRKIFSKKFIDYLSNFKFTGDIWAIPEGTVVFPNEPLITVRAPIIEAQLLETMLLLTINHQSLIATKTRRIVNQAKNRPVMEFGARRAHGADAAILGARAAIIGGAVGTSCTISAKEFNVPVSGTMAHSWIQSFDSEYEAFKAYAEIYPDSCTFLVDTYNTLKSGIPNMIKVSNEILKPLGKRPVAVRLDSGDLAYLSKEVRKLLDDAGYEDCKICVTNSLDEKLIASLFEQDAKIDLFGVGENLITAKSDPVFGGVYKLVALEKNGNIIPKIKISENVVKVTNPSYKKLFRFYSKADNKALADVITLNNEKIEENEYTIFDPINTWKKKTLNNYYVKELQTIIFKKGKLVYNSPTLKEIAEYSKKDLDTFWEEIKRIDNPHKYFVDLSQKLWNLKQEMLQNH
ncbi:MAG TPA: nicotinate phosphoribosyltransferase [Candidatus Scatovivens faecipullorum]|nr:nicotinate phosphoribosyltransferase [Candidatus Scatovivens faecipullorum]